MKFKIPSITEFQEGATDSFLRFPLSILSGIIGSISAMVMIESSSSTEDIFKNVILVCGLAIPLFYSIRIYTEVRNLTNSKYWQLNGLVFGLLIGYYFTLPENVSYFNQDYIRYVLLFISVHLLVAFIPYLFKQNSPAFWQYNNISFTRIITAGIFSVVLYIGLALSITAINVLFNVNFDGEIYGHTFFLIVGVFNTWYFLAGIPSNIEDLDKVEEYPKVIKVFAQYILLPLVSIYLLILLSYEVKIISLWDFPKGVVSYMILGVSIVGILNILLLHPLVYKNVDWVKKYEKIYFIVLVPLIVLLYIAIWMRVSDYGITENRYFLIALSLWLNGITFYFLFTSKTKIEIVPISLFVIVTLSSFGPWGAFSVSERSQFNRLYDIFDKYELIENDQFIHKEVEIEEKDLNEISSEIDYLVDYHSIDRINNLLPDEKKIALEKSSENYWNDDNTIQVVESLGFKYTRGYNRKKYVYYSTRNQAHNIKGFQNIFSFQSYTNGNCGESNCVNLYKGNNCDVNLSNTTSPINIDLGSFATELYEKYPNSKNNGWESTDELSLELNNMKIIFSEFNFNVENDEIEITRIEGYVLLKE